MTQAAPNLESPRPSALPFSTVACAQFGLLAALLLIAYWALIRQSLVGRWLSDGNWSHGPLIPLFSLYFLWSRRDELAKVSLRPSYVGAMILAGSLLMMFAGAWWWRMVYPQTVSLVGAIFGLTLLLGGWGVMRIAWFPVLFLLFAVPLPDAEYELLSRPLRQWAAFSSALIMPLFAPGLQTEAGAVVIDYIYKGTRGHLNVEQACSGMRLLMSFMALGVAMAYLHPRPKWQILIMVSSIIPIAIFCNMIRVTSTGLFHVYGRPDLAAGTPHQLLGMAMIFVAFGAYALIGWVLSRLWISDGEEE